ncbi:hypothetical protein [Spirillospora sp. CA-128828]|uniref:hypothetical protein n=1 Tax=Spirillospora sp. CA-128828 TaxID=3240033 RepID=UPI003D8C4ECF
MDTQRQAGAQSLRRLRLSRGWSWSDLATQLRALARTLRITRIAAIQPSSIRRSIARWESGAAVPDEQYRLLLGHAYARTPMGTVALGPGSDFGELLDALAQLGVPEEQLTELTGTVTAATTSSGMNLLAFVNGPLRADLATALTRPERADLELVTGLEAASDAVDAQIGAVPFARLHLAQAVIVDACRYLLQADHPAPVQAKLRTATARAYALAARLAFETHDDATALALYDEAVTVTNETALSRRALIRSSQTMVVYYATGDIQRARRIADTAVQDARRGDSVLMRARAHALQAEMAARSAQHRHAHAALHLAWHDLDADTTDDPMNGAFSRGRLRGFEGFCGIFLGQAETAERQLAASAQTLTGSRHTVQRAIVLTDRALARLHTSDAGAPEAAAEQLHECVDLTATTRGRVPGQRLRQARLELRPWRGEPFVADLDDHIHTALIGV